MAKEFNVSKEDGLSAATFPTESLRYLVSRVATSSDRKMASPSALRGTGAGQPYKRALMINDVARAFFEAPIKIQACVELPDEAKEEGEEEQMAGLLIKKPIWNKRGCSEFSDGGQTIYEVTGIRCGKIPCQYILPWRT